MKNKNIITCISILIVILSAFAAAVGIFSKGGPGPSKFMSVRGNEVELYGKGVYHQMSAEVAPQGIAQDVVTLFIAIPLLLISLCLARSGSMRGKVMLAGTLGYFLVTYSFFTLMAMYNELYLLWVLLLSLSFFGFLSALRSVNALGLYAAIDPRLPARFIGGFLMFTAIAIGFLWLSIVGPSAITGIIPVEVEHYTTLVVQALDLSILLPASFIAGLLLYKRQALGFKLAAVYIVFLSILMSALTAKVIAMASLGYNVIPVIFIIPAFNIISIICLFLVLGNIRPCVVKKYH
jgi:hypothetical protein